MTYPRVCHQRKRFPSAQFLISRFNPHVNWQPFLRLRCLGFCELSLNCYVFRPRKNLHTYFKIVSVRVTFYITCLRSSITIYKISVGLPIGVYRLTFELGIRSPFLKPNKKKISKASTIPPRFYVPSSDLNNRLYDTNKCEANTVFYKPLFWRVTGKTNL